MLMMDNSGLLGIPQTKCDLNVKANVQADSEQTVYQLTPLALQWNWEVKAT